MKTTDILTKEDEAVLRFQNTCIFCKGKDVVVFNKKGVCLKCVADLGEIAKKLTRS